MPETSQEHDDHEIDCGPDPSNPVTAERKVEVIPQGGGKGNGPGLPEIRETDGRIGKPEIVFQMEAEAERRADRAGGIAGEVEKDLSGEGNDAHPGVERDERSAITKYSIGRSREHGVGQDDFFEQAQSHERQSPKKATGLRLRWSEQLRKEIPRAHDRTGDQLREE